MQFGAGQFTRLVVATQGQLAALEELGQRVHQFQLVAQAQLDVDALHAFGVLAHARQRNHHVFVDLEGVGVPRDRRRALAFGPELLARVGADRHEAFTGA